LNTEHPTPTSALPDETRWPLFLYNALFPVALIFMLPKIALRMLRRGGYREKFSQRLGRFAHDDLARLAAREWTWVHSISVGETLLALKLARKIHELDPARNIVLSVTTSTGFAVAKPAACEWLEVIYNPIDSRTLVRRTLAVLRPRQIIFIEAVWTNLLAESKKLGIPVGFVARLSPRSERRFKKFRSLTGPIFRLLDTVCVQEPEDAARWESLGVDAARIHCMGSIKFDQSDATPSRADEFRAFVRKLGVKDNAPILLAGSTFPGEEKIVAEIFRDLRAEFRDLFLILVPRHVERTPDVIADLRPLALDIALRTEFDDAHGADVDCLIVDTTGELRDWYQIASVVFVGKSLTAVGGQNPVEPVVAGKPVLFGPHMENFATVARHLLAYGAARQVADAAELKLQIGRLLRDPSLRERAAANAHHAVASHQGATARTSSLLLNLSA
jgi:3-deoxy-D-manno-octulosonic-acid transferase